MSATHVTKIVVRYAETDASKIVWHGSYVAWLEAARVAHIASIGLPYTTFLETGYDLVVSDLQIRYLRPAFFGDTVLVESRLTKIQSRRLTLDYRVTRESDSDLLVTAQTLLICIDRNGQATIVPAEWRDLFKARMSDE